MRTKQRTLGSTQALQRDAKNQANIKTDQAIDTGQTDAMAINAAI